MCTRSLSITNLTKSLLCDDCLSANVYLKSGHQKLEFFLPKYFFNNFFIFDPIFMKFGRNKEKLIWNRLALKFCKYLLWFLRYLTLKLTTQKWYDRTTLCTKGLKGLASV